MAQRAIREFHAKKLLAQYLPLFSKNTFSYQDRIVLVDQGTDWEALKRDNPWLLQVKLVVKPDQLFGKRGKHNLVLLGANFEQARDFVQQNLGREVTIGKTTGTLTHFLIEPFVVHEPGEEYYLSARTERDKDILYFSTQGGIEIEENWNNVVTIEVPIGMDIEGIAVNNYLPASLDTVQRKTIAACIKVFYQLFVELGFAFLEINPCLIKDHQFFPLDLKARLDDTAVFEHIKQWEMIEFPPPFGQKLTPEEEKIKALDEKSGSSLKCTILHPTGRIWILVAGGGASVIYADTVADLGYVNELANYGEYSGNPTTDETYEYTKTILELMTRQKDALARPKFLLIGGGIANFTDVAKTFTGIIKALREYKQKLLDTNVKIYVRRGGPNYEEGLAKMKKVGEELGIPMEVYGPELHMTKIVSMALKSS